MKKSLSILILLTLFAVSCTHTPATKGEGTGETCTTSETATNVAPAVAKTEAELGILHPLRFADDVKIYQADDVLHRKEYEVPKMLDAHQMLVIGHPLAKGKLAATVYEVRDPNVKEERYPNALAIGYYDLDKKEMVKIRETGASAGVSQEDIQKIHLYPLDEARLLYEVYQEGGIEYFTYAFADGKLTKFAEIKTGDDYWFAGVPYLSRDHLYIPEPMPHEVVRTHVYDCKTLEEVKTSDKGAELRLLDGKEVYLTGYASGDTAWTEELHIGHEITSWESAKKESLLEMGVTSEPQAVYTLTQYLDSRELEEDLTEEDRTREELYTPYVVVRDETAKKDIVRMRGSYLEMRVSEGLLGLWKVTRKKDQVTRSAYFYLPKENCALRVTVPETCTAFLMLQAEPYAVLFGDQEANEKTLTVYTFEKTESH